VTCVTSEDTSTAMRNETSTQPPELTNDLDDLEVSSFYPRTRSNSRMNWTRASMPDSGKAL